MAGAWERVGPILRDVIGRRSVTEVHTRTLPTNPRTQPRLRGAIALVL
ncbi:MAG TPA: hypothetical protein VKA67_12690 [Verrucomicrobiae bacterium]|nr:hypothetical protein [Verrucomicrobiae bacterium]